MATIDWFIVGIGLLAAVGFPLALVVTSNQAMRRGKTLALAYEENRKDVARRWAAFAESLGLRIVQPVYLEGLVNGREVIVDEVHDFDAQNQVRYRIRLRVKLPAGASSMMFEPEGFVAAGDTETGDPTFDDRFNLGRREHAPLALFRHDVRERLFETLLGDGLEISSGYFVVRGPDDLKWARNRLEGLTALANDLDVTDEAARLAEMASKDPEQGVRLRALGELGGRFHAQAVTRKVARGALSDTDPAVRRKAFTLFASLEDGKELRAHLPVALTDPDDGVRALALDHVTDSTDGDHFDLVLAAADNGGDTLQAAAARTLGRLGDARAEELLVAMLDRDSEMVRVEAARALGGLGGLGAVEPLLKCTEGFRTPASLKEVARESVRRIQARAGSADAGRLSIAQAAEESGALSLATEGGELSVVDGQARERG